MARGYVFHAGTAYRNSDEHIVEVDLRLVTNGGMLQLPEATGRGVLYINGVPIFADDLTRVWAKYSNAQSEQPVANQIPAMPEGSYVYCDLTLEESLLVMAGVVAPTSGSCTKGHLIEDGMLILPSPHIENAL